jgi:DeoR family transcriptional regulator of aga operon
MMGASSKTVVLADSSKLGQRGFGHIAPLDEVDILITDDGITKEMRDIIEEIGIELIIA